VSAAPDNPSPWREKMRILSETIRTVARGRPKLAASLPEVLLALLVAGNALTARAANDIELFWKLTPSILKVEAANLDGSISIGSGVVVGRGVVATNCHVTRRAVSIAVTRGSARRSVESQFSDVEHDLCLLKAPLADSEPVVAISPLRPQIGQAVFAVGFINGIAPRVSSGKIEAVYEYDGGKVMETSASFTSGASGGGLFDAEGRLVGIVAFMSRGAEGARHFCLPASWVAQAVEHFDGHDIAPLDGSPFWQQPRERQPYFLRAVALQAERAWPQLADIARRWSFAESDNPSPWVALGTAYAHLDLRSQSIDAYRTAVAIDGAFAPAWYGLGLAYADDCRPGDAERIHTVLESLDQGLAKALSRHYAACGSGGGMVGG